MTALGKRKNKTGKSLKSKQAPLYSKDGIPYDYIIIIDAGSKGSRVYVYNWLNPTAALENGINLNRNNPLERVKLVRRFEQRDDDDDEQEEESNEALLPQVQTKEKWHKKITPGISSFDKNPKKIGKQHLYYLLERASQIIPKSQHYRTPIFLHATADCSSHVNVIHGEDEGLFGWLSINSIIGSFDHPELHQHGNNHSTYGLLDMGGASTQVVFQPNTTEVEEHQQNLYHVLLNQVPKLSTSDEDTEYSSPNPIEFNVYSDSFLGFGMYQAHKQYFKYLRDKFNKEKNIDHNAKFRSNIPDPCLPKGHVTSQIIDGYNYDFTGESDFNECLNNIFPVLQNSTNGSINENCNQFNETAKASSCLLNNSIPVFDFNINHFAAVSGYWNSIEDLLSYQNSKRDKEDQKNTYDYKVIFDKTEKVCSSSYSQLLEFNEDNKSHKLSEEELSELCFKSSWILNFLHLGLGFPRFGIDEITNTTTNGFESLQMIEQLGGTQFSWTLGRAILYSNDEYVQAYNNYTTRTTNTTEVSLLKRSGYYHRSSESLYHYGAEQSGIPPRPAFITPRADQTYKYFDYEKSSAPKSEFDSSPSNNHRWYGMFAFLSLVFVVGWLMIGSSRRRQVVHRVKAKMGDWRRMVPGYNDSKYVQLGPDLNDGDDLENGYELDDIVDSTSSSSSSNIDQQFQIGDEDEEDDDSENLIV
ncbi:uncharacterized protein J8A68_005928 [[Candida] subhashii]|uniref:Golgi apyrase n=1 Tax=[Candida] subhashii TaxID=561895 RepID=A0A8J5Q125_9ASCO|nr:uncharacterized protein J8A68_005928 [[Candida] subhashii]KAG7660509.1 hypothetical protein J8A68_005928 [[Candida] subhashii]